MSGRVATGELGARFVDVKVADTAPAAHGPTNVWKQLRLGRHAIQEMLPMADIGFLRDAVVGLELSILALIPRLGNVAWRPASDLR